jgi:single-strand DNA-binding protein
MASLNKVLLIGNLTRDPEVRMMSSGRPVCNFGLALNRNYKDAEGNKKEEVTFVDVECFGPCAEAVGRFFSKGRAIFVEGRLKLDQWETKEGEKRSAIRVVLDNFEFVDAGKSDGHTTSDQSNRPVTPTEKPKPQESLSDDNGFDEDVPF